MTAANIKNFIKTMLPDAEVIVNGINANVQKCIGVYDAKTPPEPRVCIGGKKNTKWQPKRFSILVHWTDSPVECEKFAQQIKELFHGKSNLEMDGIHVCSCAAANPSWAGRADNRVCEYIIKLDINYKEENDNA